MQKTFSINSNKKQEFINITSIIERFVEKSDIGQGICNIFIPHATAAISVNENADPNIEKDFFKALNKMILPHDNYEHDKIDNNAPAHIAATIIGPNKIFPIKDGKLLLGRWQDIFLIELDGPRKRNIIINLVEG